MLTDAYCTLGKLRGGMRPCILWAQTFPSQAIQIHVACKCYLGFQQGPWLSGLPDIGCIMQDKSHFTQSPRCSSRQWVWSSALHGKDEMSNSIIWKGTWYMKTVRYPRKILLAIFFIQARLFWPWFNKFLNLFITLSKCFIILGCFGFFHLFFFYYYLFLSKDKCKI